MRGAQSNMAFQLGSYSAHEYTSVINAGERPPDFSNPTVESAGSLVGGLGYEFLKQFRLSVDLDPTRMMPILKGQWQWLGSPSVEAEAGDWSSSLGLQLSFSRVSKTGDQTSAFGDGGNPWEGNIRGSSAALMTSVGYRPTDKFLIFLGAAHARLEVRTSIDQSANVDQTDLGGSYQVSDRGRATTVGLGGLIGRRVVGLVKFESTQVRYERVSKNERIDQLLFGILF